MQSEEGLVEALSDGVGKRARQDYKDQLSRILPLCESPIERVLMAAAVAWPIEGVTPFNKSAPFPYDTIMYGSLSSVMYVGGIYPQVQIGDYRVDVYLEAFDQESERRWLRLAIECDGHNFHEITKEQARRDKRRDRWLKSQGVTVLRFAGSEIWADPEACWDEVENMFWAEWQRTYRQELP